MVLKGKQLIDTRAELENAIIIRNQRHFAQAKGTPFTMLPLKHIHQQNFDTKGIPTRQESGGFAETKLVIQILQDLWLQGM